MFSKNNILALFITIMLILIPSVSLSAVIFSESFDNIPSGWNCSQYVPVGWASLSACGSATYGGVTHYGGEITSGGRTGNSLKAWKQGQFPGDASYYGLLNYDFGADRYRDVYMRWYMKIPPGFNMTGFDYLKLWRWNFGSGGSYDKEIYLNFLQRHNGTTFWGDAHIGVYKANGDNEWAVMLENSDLPTDGQWHCYEWRVQLNTTGSSNGVLQFWLDGVLKYSATNVNYGATTTDYLRRTSLGTGNRNSGSAFQTGWQAIEFDDYVLSTTYIGPDGSPPAPSPSPSPDLTPAGMSTLFTEGFDDSNLSARGWFDNPSVTIDNSVKYSGSGSARFTWAQGSQGGFGTLRKDFTATETLYVSFYWRFNSDWVGSGVGYHPHIIYILSDLDDHWGGLAQNYLDTYIEVSNLTPRMIIQDGMNVNYSYGSLPNNLTATTENRDVAGCNGCLAGSDCGDTSACYAVGGGTYLNGRFWNGSLNFNRNTWHKVEVYLKMNTISAGRAVADGIMWMKVDGNYVINKTKMVYRTNQRPNMKWRTFVIAPYMGDGSPQLQTMWMDNLTVATGGTSDPVPVAVPSAPTGLRVLGN